jgi:hypothetical protein
LAEWVNPNTHIQGEMEVKPEDSLEIWILWLKNSPNLSLELFPDQKKLKIPLFGYAKKNGD